MPVFLSSKISRSIYRDRCRWTIQWWEAISHRANPESVMLNQPRRHISFSRCLHFPHVIPPPCTTHSSAFCLSPCRRFVNSQVLFVCHEPAFPSCPLRFSLLHTHHLSSQFSFPLLHNTIVPSVIPMYELGQILYSHSPKRTVHYVIQSLFFITLINNQSGRKSPPIPYPPTFCDYLLWLHDFMVATDTPTVSCRSLGRNDFFSFSSFIFYSLFFAFDFGLRNPAVCTFRLV